MRVLVAEDHRTLNGLIVSGLRREGLAVDAALDGLAALEVTVGFQQPNASL